MAINFPDNPTSGQTYTYNGISWSWNGSAWTKAIGNYVNFLNGLTGGVTLAQGSNITLTPSGNTITIAASGGGASGGISTVNGFTAGATGNVNVDRLINGASVVSLGATGSVLLPGGGKITDVYLDGGISIVGLVGATSNYAGIVSGDLNQFVAATPDFVQIGTDLTGAGHSWNFDKSGVLTLPGGGYIAGLQNTVTINGATAWHAGNDGATSALDAGLLYGVQGNIYASSLSTGLLYGGLLSINAGNTATFDITAGAGYIVTTGATFTAEPNPVITKVTWTAKTGVTLAGITGQDTTWVYIDSTGAVKQQAAFFTDDQVQSTIAVGALVHPSRSYISLAKTIPNVSYATDKQYEQFIRSFGPLKVSGHTIQANDGNLRLNRTSGTAFILGRNYPNDPNNPSVVTDIAKTDAEIWRYYRGITAGTFTTVTGITTGIDPTKYDDGTGILHSVSPSTPFTIQRVFFFPGTPNVLGVYYGRQEYASLAEAANNIHLEDFTEITNTATNAVLAAFVIVKYNTTNLDTAIAANDAHIIQGGQFRTTSSGGGSVATNLDSLSDVIITSVQDDDLLIYDTTTSQWLNTPLAHIGVSRFNGLTGAISGVNSVNGLTGALSLLASTGISIAAGGKGITFTNTGVQSFNGSTGAVTGVNSANGLTGTLTFFGGTGISVQAGGKGITLINTGVSSVNGLTGAVTLTSVSTGTVNNFTAQQNFTAGLSAASTVTFVNGISTDSILSTSGIGGTLYLNSDSVGSGGGSITYIGDWAGDNNGTNLVVDDANASISFNASAITIQNGYAFGPAGAFVDCATPITTTTTTANQVIATVSADGYRSVEFYVQAQDTVGLKYESLKIMAIHDGTNTFNTQYGLIRSSTSLGTYTTTLVTLGGGEKVLRLRVTPTSTNSTTFTVIETALPI